VDSCPPSSRHSLESDLSVIYQDVALGVSHQRAAATDSTWNTWHSFCSTLHIDPTLQSTADPILPLQVFAHRYRRGEISPSKTKVRGKTVGDALRAVGQTLSNMGYADPRLNPSGKLNFRLSRLLSSYNKTDPPPSRVKPIPTSIIMHTISTLRLATHPRAQALADMITLGFYFLLRPGEYAHTTNPESTPFRLIDVHLQRGQTRIAHLHCPLAELDTATFLCLEFTNQKNGVRGELIGLGRSGNPAFCPVQASANRIRHLRTFHAPPTLPLFAYFATTWQSITSSNLTAELKNAITILGHTVGLTPSDVSTVFACSDAGAPMKCFAIYMYKHIQL